MASAAPTAETAAPPAAAAPKSRKGLLIGVAVAVLAAAGGGGYFMFGKPKADAAHGAAASGEHGAPSGHGEGEPASAAGAANYLALDPAFVVNLEDPEAPRYLQADVQVMSRDAAALETVKAHLPRIRNSLLMLFGQQKPADLATRAGKEKLLAAALAEIQKVMQAETGKPVVEAAYFTSFVMQ